MPEDELTAAVDLAEARAQGADSALRLVLSLIDAHSYGTEIGLGGWSVRPMELREHVASRLSTRSKLSGQGPRGPLERVRTLAGLPDSWWGSCPWCARVVLLNPDQFAGRAECTCRCGYAEAHDYSTLPAWK